METREVKAKEPRLWSCADWRRFRQEELDSRPAAERHAMLARVQKEQEEAARLRAAREGKDASDYYEDVKHHSHMLAGLADLICDCNDCETNWEAVGMIVREHAEAIQRAAEVARYLQWKRSRLPETEVAQEGQPQA